MSFNRIQKNLSKSTFELIPLLDFNKSFSDLDLYKKFDLDEKEIDYIEKNIKKME